MAATANTLTSGSSSTSGTSFATASISPASNRLILAAVVTSRGGNANAQAPTLSGNGLTWVEVGTVGFDTVGFSRTALTLFRALLTTPPTVGAVTISVAASHQACAWSIVEFGNVLTTGANGADAVRQAVTNMGNSTGMAVTLAAFGDSDNATYGCFGLTFDRAVTNGSGFSELHEVQNTLGTVQSEWKTTNDTSVDASQATATLWGGIAVEIVEFIPPVPAGSGSTTISTAVTISASGSPGADSDFDYATTIEFDTLTDLTDRVRSYRTTRGRPFNLDRVEAGTSEILLTNGDGELDPANPDSSLFPNVLPLKELWLARRESGVTYDRFRGPVERYVPTWVPAANYQEIAVHAADAFETLANTQLVNDHASLQTGLTGTNNDLVYTALEAGASGDQITVEYLVEGNNTTLEAVSNTPIEGAAQMIARLPTDVAGLTSFLAGVGRFPVGAAATIPITVQGTDITVAVATDGSGNPTSTASQVLAALEASEEVMNLVSVELASGDSGAGVVTALGRTNLTGGKFPQETTGSRIGRVLDRVGWPGDKRQIDPGIFEVIGSGFGESENVSALTHIQDVADSELGYAFIAGNGDLVFHDGGHRGREDHSTASQATYTDQPDGSGFTYQDMTLSLDKERVVNHVTVTAGAEGAVPQVVEDIDSQIVYSRPGHPTPRSLSKQTLLAHDTDALSIATVILDAYKDARTRVEHLVLMETGASGWSEGVLGRDIGDRVTISMSPPGWSSTVSYECFVEQIEDSRAAGEPWTVTFRATPISESVSVPPGGGGGGAVVDSSGDEFVLDSATLGVLA